MVGTALARHCPPYNLTTYCERSEAIQLSAFASLAMTERKDHFPVFTLVQSRLMMRWVAGSRAWMTNSFFCIASSG